MMNETEVYRGFEIKREVNGFEVFMVWENHGMFSTIEDAKEYIDIWEEQNSPDD